MKQMKGSVLLVVMLAVFADMFVYGVLVPFVPIYATTLGASQAIIGLLFGCYAVALLITTPIFGVLSDRLGRRSLLLFGSAGLFVATILFVYANTILLLGIARFLQGIAAAATWSAGFALLADVFPTEERGKSMGIALSGMIAGTLLGPPIGGLLYDHGGKQLPFLCAALLPLLVFVLLLAVLKKTPHPTTARPESNPFQLLSSRVVLSIIFIVLLGAFIPSVLEPTLPLLLHQNLHATPTIIGVLFVISPLTYTFCAPLAGMLSDRMKRIPTMIFGLILMAVALPLTSISSTYLLEVGSLLLLGVGIGFALTPSMPELSDTVDRLGQNAYGVAFALYNMAYFVGLLAGPIFGGVLSNQLHLPLTLLIVAGIVILGALALVLTGMHVSPPVSADIPMADLQAEPVQRS